MNLPLIEIMKYQKKVDAKNSAVALHIKVLKSKIQIILIERSKYPGMHSQQIAFPGGKKDINDLSLEYTARRESLKKLVLKCLMGL